MDNVFIINPAAGQGDKVKWLSGEIDRVSSMTGQSCRVEYTRAVGTGEIQARQLAEKLNGVEARFFACGGDGTLNEVANGIYGFVNIELGCVPIGTGNDYIRNFGSRDIFMDIAAQINGTSKTVDLIRYRGKINDVEKDRYCINMVNIGFDSNIVECAGRMKKKPLVAGTGAYLLAVVDILAKKKGVMLKIENGDGEVLADGQLLLCAIAKGMYCGGGFKGVPHAFVDDGLMAINVVRDMNRRKIMGFLPKYRNGTHVNARGADEIIIMKKTDKLTVTPLEDDCIISFDGEIEFGNGPIVFTSEPKAVRFIIPEKEVEAK